ncbi:MAG TPA: efflux RND transporter periplasmic adaptor subunit [Gemmatimonadales bacterium]|nr:efflux RND transporter periplasmic adaptor subunit [Gemmatimonadales bacterium]
MRPISAAWLILAAVGACKQAESEGGAGGPGGGPPAMPVEAAAARSDTVVDAILATGQIEAMQSIELRPDVEGRLVQILVREGSPVARGTPLFKIDDAELKAQTAQVEAERDLARQSLTRTRDLLSQKASSQAELERAEATMRSSEAQLERLKVRLNRTLVRAPFAGVMGQRFVSLGDYVTTDTRLASLQTVTPQRASFQVPERYAEQLDPGQRVTFRVAALPGREFTGIVDFVDPVVQLPGRTILVKARVPNPRRELQSGMFIEARLATAVRPNAVVIPEDAVLPLQGTNFVWVVADGKATRRQVELGVRTPGFVEVRSGVENHEQVVVGGQERLAEGAPVQAQLVDRRPLGGQEETGAGEGSGEAGKRGSGGVVKRESVEAGNQSGDAKRGTE